MICNPVINKNIISNENDENLKEEIALKDQKINELEYENI